MSDANRDEGTLRGGIGIGMQWNADGSVKAPLTKDHERLDRRVQKAKRRWEKTGLDSDYDKFEELEERLDRAIEEAYLQYDG